MRQEQTKGGIAGVYKGTRVIVIGTGATKQRKKQEALFFAEQTGEDEVSVQPLNDKFLPVSPTNIVPLEEFLKSYAPEPEVFKKKTLPAISNMRKTIARAERLRSQGETYTAEYEFQNALKMDDTNARANYGLGLTYLDRGETQQAEAVLKRLVTLETAYTKENKHLFNEFGIKLRKSGMLDQALAYYGRAMSLAPKDEHLFYNIARVLYEKKDLHKALAFTVKALAYNPDLEAAQHLSRVLEKEGATLPEKAPGEKKDAKAQPDVAQEAAIAAETIAPHDTDSLEETPSEGPPQAPAKPASLPGDDVEDDRPFDD